MTSNKNKLWQPFMIVGYTIVLLFILSFFKLPVGFFNNSERLDILSDIKKSPILTKQVVIEKKDSVVIVKNSTAPKDSTLITDYGYEEEDAISTFYKKLDSTKTWGNKVRIAYFGDSFIEGDEITDEIRLQLQSIYGGNGIGFLPVQSSVNSLYTQLKMSCTGWIDYNFRENPYKYSLGLSGHLFYPYIDAIVEYTPKTNWLPTEAKLYSGQLPEKATIRTTVNGKVNTVTIFSSQLVNENSLSTATPINSIKINTKSEDLPIYGVSLEGNQGVYLDNYSFRGNTSILTQQISKVVMSGLNKYLHYDLIIIHYGINAVEHDKQTFPWFETSMNTVVKNMRKGFGKVPILLVSTSDMGYKYNGKYGTEKGIPYLVATQNKIARTNKVAFWNLYEAMGGENTITKWVEGDTVFAAKDYIHMNVKGAKKIGDLFFDKLMTSKKYFTTTLSNHK